MVRNNTPIRLSDEYREFLFRLGSNRVIVKLDKKPLSATVLSDLIVRYFKNNNDRYLELINMENKNV